MRLSCQLYTLRDVLNGDPDPIFEKLSQAGLEYVETAGFGALTPVQYRAALDRTGLKVSASHVGLAEMESHMNRVIDDASTIGTQTLVVPWLDEKDRGDFNKLADRLNPLSEKATQAGLGLAYHNHDFEFKLSGNGLPLDHLYEAVPALRAQFDLGWIHYAGYDPVDFLKKYTGRIDSVHLKDSRRGHSTMDLAPGEGELPYATLIAEASKARADYGTIEIDLPRGDALQVVLDAITYFHALGLK